MMPSGPHSSTMGTGEASSVSVTVFRLCGHAESGPRPVEVQSYLRISAAASPPLAGKDPPDPADPALSDTSSPSQTPQLDADQTRRIGPGFRSQIPMIMRSDGISIRPVQCFAALLAAALLSTISPST